MEGGREEGGREDGREGGMAGWKDVWMYVVRRNMLKEDSQMRMQRKDN